MADQGVLPAWAIDQSPGPREPGRPIPQPAVRRCVAGIDLPWFTRASCAWQMTAYNRRRRWSLDGIWEKILDGLRADSDEAEGNDWAISADSTVATCAPHSVRDGTADNRWQIAAFLGNPWCHEDAP